ncbi:MAG: response regulator, partial [Runella slithyformis]
FTFETKETIISPTQQQNKAQEIHIENFLKQYAPTILLVDDNFVNRKVASEILRKAGCVVDTAESGKRAIELVMQTHDIAKKYYDVILMDIQMPDMDGIETTQRLRAQFGKYLPPIVAMTAYSMKEDRARFLSQGMDEYVPKPIRAQVLIQKIKELMEANKAKENGEIIPQKPLPTPQEMAIPVIDDEVVKQLLGLGGMELVVSIFEEFVIESTELVNGALAAFATGDIATVKSNLHTIKGSAGTIGVARVAEMARIGEAKLKTNDTSTLAHDLPQLDQAFQVFLREYQLYLETMAIN